MADTQTSIIKPSLFISVTKSTVRDSLHGIGAPCVNYLNLYIIAFSPPPSLQATVRGNGDKSYFTLFNILRF